MIMQIRCFLLYVKNDKMVKKYKLILLLLGDYNCAQGWHYLRISQLIPTNPGLHVQEYWLTKLLQMPPFIQGLLLVLHSLISVENKPGLK